MTQANLELLHALKEAGASEPTAEAAARSVATADQVATRADLRATLAELKEWFAWRLVAVIAPLYVGIAYLAIRIAG